jgi:hypothetical protein
MCLDIVTSPDALASCCADVEKAADIDIETGETVTEAGASSRRCEGLARHLQQFVLAIGPVARFDSAGEAVGLLKR